LRAQTIDDGSGVGVEGGGGMYIGRVQLSGESVGDGTGVDVATGGLEGCGHGTTVGTEVGVMLPLSSMGPETLIPAATADDAGCVEGAGASRVADVENMMPAAMATTAAQPMSIKTASTVIVSLSAIVSPDDHFAGDYIALISERLNC
jgi:hypothetical protein